MARQIDPQQKIAGHLFINMDAIVQRDAMSGTPVKPAASLHLADRQAAMRSRIAEQAAPPRVDQKDRPYSISELMILHGLSRRSVIKLYETERDVLVLQAPRDHRRKIGRSYRTLRVPRHVHLRVRHRMEVR